MPLESLTREAASGVREPQIVFSPGTPGGTLTVNPAFAELFARAGLTSASAFLDLPGEVVSGHPDRHVVRVEVPGAPHAFYLKRQHVVGWREKLRNRLAGFGWASRCEREAAILQQLEAANLPAPRWTAFGAHDGRAFLLVEEVPGASDLRRVLSDNALSSAERRRLAANVGAAVAAVHATGFSTPELTAKHILVCRETLSITFLDWQSATRGTVCESARADALGALHASLAEGLATPAERVRVLRAYRDLTGHSALVVQASGLQKRFRPEARTTSRASTCRVWEPGLKLATQVLRAAGRHAKRRSVRDQLQPVVVANPQRLVWLSNEAVCAVPEVAALWPRPAIAPPFYGFGPDGASRVRFAGRDAVLLRGRTVAPLGRFHAWLRAAPWRSPGVTAGRVLFHLARYGVPAPGLLAFGQRFVSASEAEWFALHESPAGVSLRKWRRTAPSVARRVAFESATECLRKLHDASCVLLDAREAFAVEAGRVSVADPRAVRIVRRVSESARRRDLRAMAHLLGME